MITFTLNTMQFFTLNPDGSEYQELTGGDTILFKNRIGEYKKVVLNYSSSFSMVNNAVWFSPILFFNYTSPQPITGKPADNFFYFKDDGTLDGGTMSLNCAIPYSSDLIKNYEATIDYDAYGTGFTITLKYYQIYDLTRALNPAFEDNHSKLLKDCSDDPNELTVALRNIYNSALMVPHFYIYSEEDADNTNYGSKYSKEVLYRAGFYAKNETNTSPSFTSPVFILENQSAVAQTTILTIDDTKVRFRANLGSAMQKCFFWLIKTNASDNTIDFIDNYDASFTEAGGLTGIPNKFKAPSVAPAFISGTTYEASINIDKTKVSAGDTYRIIAIAYHFTSADVYFVNSFISDEYTVAVPSYNGAYNIDGKFQDYQQDFTGNDLICVVEERLNSVITIDYSSDLFKNDIFDRLGLTVDNDIRRYLVKVMAEIYEDEDANTRHYFARYVSTKSDPITYSAVDGLTLDFTNAYYLNQLLCTLSWRNRYESHVPNIETTYNGIPLSSPTSNQNWANRVLKVKWTFELYYDDYFLPFSDVLTFTQNLRPKGYTEDVHIYKEDGSEVSPTEYFCTSDETCLKSKFNLANPEDYKLITTADINPGNISTIAENETWVGGDIVQQTSNKFVNQEEDYSQTEATFAKFCLNGLHYFADAFYKISAMAKKKIVTCTFASGVLTLDAPQDNDQVELGTRVYIYSSGNGWYNNEDFNLFTDLIECINSDPSKPDVTIVENLIGVHTLTFTYNVCGAIGNIHALNSPSRTFFHWDIATEVGDTLTGGAG